MILDPRLVQHIGAMPWEEFRRVIETCPDQKDRQAALRYRFRTDREHFLKYCFPAYFSDPFNGYHRDVLAREWIPWRDRQAQHKIIREADAAPRGFAKTTLAKGEMAWAFCYDMEAAAVVISNEQSLAVQIARDVRAMFAEAPEPFAALYGPFKVDGGVEEFRVTFPAGHAVTCTAKSMGSQLRGMSRGGVRPTIVLLDDAERSDRVRSAKQRERWWSILHADVLKLGKAGGGLFCRLRGTVLHPDSGLNNILKEPSWQAKKFQACISWPDADAMKLWEECGAIYKDLFYGSESVRLLAAEAFYEANKAAMDKDAVMLDPELLPLFQFMLRIWSEGKQSVLQELQNDPRSGGGKFFDTSKFKMCTVVGNKQTGGHIIAADGRKIDLADIRTFARLDPIPGEELRGLSDDGGAGASDFAAIVIIGRDEYGYAYVLDVWLKRATDNVQRAQLWTLCERWQCEKATIESNGFQRLLGREFRREQAERREKKLYWQVTAEDDHSSKNKENRIATIGGPIESGWLQFAQGLPQELYDEADEFPDSQRDDALDALEGAWRLSNGSKIGMSSTPLGADRMGHLRRAA